MWVSEWEKERITLWNKEDGGVGKGKGNKNFLGCVNWNGEVWVNTHTENSSTTHYMMMMMLCVNNNFRCAQIRAFTLHPKYDTGKIKPSRETGLPIQSPFVVVCTCVCAKGKKILSRFACLCICHSKTLKLLFLHFPNNSRSSSNNTAFPYFFYFSSSHYFFTDTGRIS